MSDVESDIRTEFDALVQLQVHLDNSGAFGRAFSNIGSPNMVAFALLIDSWKKESPAAWKSKVVALCRHLVTIKNITNDKKRKEEMLLFSHHLLREIIHHYEAQLTAKRDNLQKSVEHIRLENEKKVVVDSASQRRFKLIEKICTVTQVTLEMLQTTKKNMSTLNGFIPNFSVVDVSYAPSWYTRGVKSTSVPSSFG